MTDLTPTLNELLLSKNGPSIPSPTTRHLPTQTADEFLKEAYRIVSPHTTPQQTQTVSNLPQQNSHIHSLLTYLHSIRHAYLSTTAPSQRRKPSTSRSTQPQTTPHSQSHLTDTERDAVDSSTALLLRDLAASIANLASAESLRQETEATVLRRKYGHSAAGALLWRWAAGDSPGAGDGSGKSEEQVRAEQSARTIRTVREGVLWFLRTGLEGAASVQRGMVEKRIERVREKEKSVLYKSAGAAGGRRRQRSDEASAASSTTPLPKPDAAVLSEADSAQIEAQLSPEQLQLFAEENDSMFRHYEDTLGKVQYVFLSPYILPRLDGG